MLVIGQVVGLASELASELAPAVSEEKKGELA
jgi:hypothetical protein